MLVNATDVFPAEHQSADSAAGPYHSGRGVCRDAVQVTVSVSLAPRSSVVMIRSDSERRDIPA